MITREELLLFIQYLRPYQMRIAKISILAVICAFFEAVNLSALVPLLQILNNPADPGGVLWDTLKTIFGLVHIELNFINLLIVMGIVFLIGQVLLYRKKRMQADLWFSFSADLKKTVFKNLLASDIRFHYSEKPGKFIDILNRQAEYSATAVFAVTEILTYTFFIIVYTAILLYISVPLTAICLIIALSCLWFLNFFIKRSKQIGIRCNDTNIHMNEFITERLNLTKLIKIFSTEESEAAKLTRYTDQYTKNNTDFWMNGVKIETIFQIIIFTIALIILYVSAIVLSLPLALLLVFIFILIRLTDPLRQINAKRHELGGELASLEQIDRTLRESRENQRIQGGTTPFVSLTQDLSLKNVSFAYTESIPVIKDLSFTVRKNEMIALVGASGGGKSTIVDLIIRLIDPDEGTILIDGTDIRSFSLRDYHRKIGFVSQESFIFNDTILNNICYGSESVSMERAIEAAKIANAHEFIGELPAGYHAELGERGVKLSGGP